MIFRFMTIKSNGSLAAWKFRSLEDLKGDYRGILFVLIL